jgi:hypothetical protein
MAGLEPPPFHLISSVNSLALFPGFSCRVALLPPGPHDSLVLWLLTCEMPGPLAGDMPNYVTRGKPTASSWSRRPPTQPIHSSDDFARAFETTPVSL